VATEQAESTKLDITAPETEVLNTYYAAKAQDAKNVQ